MYAALRMGVLWVSGKSTLGKSSSAGCTLSRFVSAPMPEPAWSAECRVDGWGLPTSFQCEDSVLPPTGRWFDEVTCWVRSSPRRPLPSPGAQVAYPEQSVSKGPPPDPRTTISNTGSETPLSLGAWVELGARAPFDPDECMCRRGEWE